MARSRTSASVQSTTLAAVAEGTAIVERALEEMPPRPKSVPPRPPRAAYDSGSPIEQRIAHIVECKRRNRLASAGLALNELRKWYEASDPLAFPDDERTWPEFVAKRVPLEPARIRDLVGAVLYRGGALQCTGCGTASACQCACGVPYVPEQVAAAAADQARAREVSALERAIAAIKADPEKSNRAIAAANGLAEPTVRRARARLKGDAVNDAVSRIGRDGRRRRMPGSQLERGVAP